MGLIQRIITSRQMFGEIPTYCVKCKKPVTLSEIDSDGSYTKKCGCGCEIYRYHAPDEHHETAFFTKRFISRYEYRENFKNLDNFEKNGFLKKELRGKVIYAK